jgi:hypothetical protein
MFKKHSEVSRRPNHVESLESRLLFDAQIGTVTMPFNGALSAAVYNSDGLIVRTLLSMSPQTAGNVNLTWDG